MKNEEKQVNFINKSKRLW